MRYGLKCQPDSVILVEHSLGKIQFIIDNHTPRIHGGPYRGGTFEHAPAQGIPLEPGGIGSERTHGHGVSAAGDKATIVKEYHLGVCPDSLTDAFLKRLRGQTVVSIKIYQIIA